LAKLKFDRGTTYSRTLHYEKNGAPATLVGATVRFTMKSDEYDEDTTDASAKVVKNVTSHTDASGGISTIALTPSDTATVAPGKYYYDIKVEEASGNIYKVDEGTITLGGSPTNRMD